MDVFSKKKRSEIMSKIRGKNTGIENEIFAELRKRKIYFQRHYNKAPGNPDIAFPRKKVAVFIDGDFWHGYLFDERKTALPKTYWIPKIERNIERDREVNKQLKRQDWKVVRIWEHDVKKDVDKCVAKILKSIGE